MTYEIVLRHLVTGQKLDTVIMVGAFADLAYAVQRQHGTLWLVESATLTS